MNTAARRRFERQRRHTAAGHRHRERRRRDETRTIAALLQGGDPPEILSPEAWLRNQLGSPGGSRVLRRSNTYTAAFEAITVGLLLREHPPDRLHGIRQEGPAYQLLPGSDLPLLPDVLLAVWTSLPGVDSPVGVRIDRPPKHVPHWYLPRASGRTGITGLERMLHSFDRQAALALRGRVWTIAAPTGTRLGLVPLPLVKGDRATDDLGGRDLLERELLPLVRHLDLLDELDLVDELSLRVTLPAGSEPTLHAALLQMSHHATVIATGLLPETPIPPRMLDAFRRYGPSVAVSRPTADSQKRRTLSICVAAAKRWKRWV